MTIPNTPVGIGVSITVIALGSYLVGAIPFGFLLGKLIRGIDIRRHGSGNIGATNVFRTFGPRLGVATFLLDAAKGVAAARVAPWAVWALAGAGDAPPAAALVGTAAVLAGHGFPLFLGFKGGKGVATGLGCALSIVPHTALAALAVWIAVFLATRYVSVGSIAAALAAAAAPWFLDSGADAPACALVTALALLIVWKHRSNVRRLLAGSENRFCFTARQREQKEKNLTRAGVKP